jgi:transcriptional regulator with XRE-family HTH domain
VVVAENRSLFDSVEHPQDRVSTRPPLSVERKIGRDLAAIAATIGHTIRDERRRRGLTLRELARLAAVGLGTVRAAEAGQVCALRTYVRLADALRLRAEFELADPRRREPPARRATDPVHAAIGEGEAVHLRGLGFEVGLDEPFQHFQFAGRADVVAWSAEQAAILHIENRARFPDLQDTLGSFNAKRRFLGAELSARAGIPRWRSETHVIAAL